VLTLTFEIVGGRLVGLSWDRILSDYNIRRGGLLPLGLLAVTLAPLLAAWARGVVLDPPAPGCAP